MIIPDALFQKMHNLTDEQLMLIQTVREYTDEQIVPNRERYDKEGLYPRDVHDAMLELGVLGMALPEEHGGLGMGMMEAAMVYEELARGDTGVATSIGSNSLGTDPFLLFGTDEQKAKYLPQVAEGAVVAYALTEPDAGSDAGGIRTIAIKSEDGKTWKLKGQKTFITNAGVANLYSVFALTDPSRGARGTSFFIVEVDPENPAPGIEFPKKFDKMGIHASETREIIFEDYEVSNDNIIGGKPGRGFLQAMGVFDASRPMIGAMGIGLARAAFEAALLYAHQRAQFGSPIINFLGLRGMFVDMWLTIEGARAMVYNGARRVDRKMHATDRAGQKEDVTAWSAMAKIMGSEASRVTLEALQATGGYGYMNESPFPKMVRDHKILEIYEGTNQIQRQQAALQVVKEFQKAGTVVPPELEAFEQTNTTCGGQAVALGYKVVNETVRQATEAGDDHHPLTERQDLLWLLGEMTAFAESARSLTEACGRTGEPCEHWIHALGECYSRDSLAKIADRSERVLRAVRPELVEPLLPLYAQAREQLNGLYHLRDRLGKVVLDASNPALSS
jgi:alkylation response protein AidB-like acyl-CoA dehydrogenase